MWEKTTPGTEIPRIFCAGIGHQIDPGIGPLQLGVVLVYIFGQFLLDLWKGSGENDENKHNAELQRADPGKKVTG